MKKSVVVIISVVVVVVVGLFIFGFSMYSKANSVENAIFSRVIAIIDRAFGFMDNSQEEQDKSIDEFNENYDKATEIIDEIKGATSEESTEFETQFFNSTYELYSGSQSGLFVKKLLEKVSTNNKKQTEHIIVVMYGTTTTSDSNEITNIKQTLEDVTNYEVSLDYDTTGFINKVTITQI